MTTRSHKDLKVGDTAELAKTLTDAQVRDFAEMTGDLNPIHLDDDYAATTQFGRRIVHGVLVSGLISAVLGTKLPGPGAIYLSQTLQFRKPVFLGDTVTALVEVLKIREDKPIVTVRTICRNQDGIVIIEGEAVLIVPR